MNRGIIPPDRPAYINWAETFAYEFMELCNGENDIHSLIDWAYEIQPQRGAEDPVAVARSEHALMMQKDRERLEKGS